MTLVRACRRHQRAATLHTRNARGPDGETVTEQVSLCNECYSVAARENLAASKRRRRAC